MAQENGFLKTYAIPFCLLMCVLIAVGLFLHRAAQENKARAYSWLSQSASYQARVITSSLNGMYATLESFALILGQRDIPVPYLVQDLNAIRTACNFDFTVLLDSNGTGMNHTGKTNIDLSTRDYFYAAKEGRRALAYVSSGAVDTKNAFLGLAVPILRNRQFAGAVYGSYNVKHYAALLAEHNNAGSSFTRVVDRFGTPIISTSIHTYPSLKEDLQKAIASLERRKGTAPAEEMSGGTFDYTANGKHFYVTFAPLRIENSGWYIVNVLDSAAVDITGDLVPPHALALLLELLVLGMLLMFFLFRKEQLRVRLEEAILRAEEACQAKNEFLSRMSHEMRTPMNGIMGMTRMARDHLHDAPRVGVFLEKIDFASRLLLSLISDVLDMASVESQRLHLSNELFDLRIALTSLTSLHSEQCKEKDLTFKVILSEVTAEQLVGDVIQLNKALLHILSNAVKFTDPGGSVTLRVRQFSGDDNTVWFCFSITDTGCGMSPETLQHLFTPFEQTENKRSGVGLGLAVSSGLVNLMGGTIDAVSQLGQGSTITITLPFELPKNEAAPQTLCWPGLRAVVVADHPDMLQALSSDLARMAIQCLPADSGKASLELIGQVHSRGETVDLFLMDCTTSLTGGLAVVNRLRTRFPSVVRHVALIVPYDEDLSPAVQADSLLPSPVFPSTLCTLIMNLTGTDIVATPQHDIQNTYNFSGRRILLAEDNPLNMEIAVSLLQDVGLQVDCAENGQVALERLHAEAPTTYAALLTDIQMPVMNGYELACHVRASSFPAIATLPIIAISANTCDADVAKAKDCGILDYISKPIEVERLYSSLQANIR